MRQNSPRTNVLGYFQAVLSKLAFLQWFYASVINSIAGKARSPTLSSRPVPTFSATSRKPRSRLL